MVKIPAYMNSEPLDVIYTPLTPLLKSYMTGHKKYNSWVIAAAELQLNGGTPIPKDSNIFHLKFLINITIKLVNYGLRDLKLLLAQIYLPFYD